MGLLVTLGRCWFFCVFYVEPTRPEMKLLANHPSSSRTFDVGWIDETAVYRDMTTTTSRVSILICRIVDDSKVGL